MKLDWDCIGFTLTVGWEARDSQPEQLTDYHSLVAWCEERGILSNAYAEQARQQAEKRPEQACAVVEQAHALRLVIYRILSAIGTGHAADATNLEELNAFVQRALAARRLKISPTGVEWTWQLDPLQMDHVLVPIAWSTVTLLTSPESERLRVCAADDCGWLFIDASRNRSRRWCTMSDCGNRAKVRRFRRRQVKGTGTR